MPTNDLIDFMQSATDEMSAEYNRIQKRALEDPGTAGDQGEENWAELLRKWLPSTFKIVTKGRIVGIDGVASPQVDVIILRPEYPPSLENEKLYLAGGVLAAFECKLTLKSKHLKAFFDNSKQVKSRMQYELGTPYKELQSPIIYGLLAHSHSWNGLKSKPIEIIEEAINQGHSASDHPVYLPDFICIANLSCWTVNKVASSGLRQFKKGSIEYEGFLKVFGKDSRPSTCYMRQYSKSASDFKSIGALTTGLLCKISWQVPTLRPIAKYFKGVKLEGSGLGKAFWWTLEIYSDKLKAVIDDKLINDMDSGQFTGNNWNEWSRFI
ncbi:hypothetical protein IDJ77_11500 [Mucilaginibacter sp. ZT4R22]|uniref:DUF6602 domain-containing protein n=1 Tax=Mucilaginibacter pankratovii TaxID=2772110 RepID=A0ABR7WQ34_9SPHI|nr:DUF6602 domain-containing protein [Mucilaginibacter pankratovii]MBD1364434.1 hypothetical protein [Mucilaginibacter pankratovii]